jgi:plasmid stabilization system protein ParE
MELLDLPSIVRQDVVEVLAFTKDRFGDAKASQYADLIQEALEDLTRDPQSGRCRAEIHPDAWVYPIGKPGRKARHLFLYSIVEGVVTVYGFLYDGQNLPAQFASRRPT